MNPEERKELLCKQTAEGWTALMVAAQNGHTAVAGSPGTLFADTKRGRKRKRSDDEVLVTFARAPSPPAATTAVASGAATGSSATLFSGVKRKRDAGETPDSGLPGNDKGRGVKRVRP